MRPRPRPRKTPPAASRRSSWGRGFNEAAAAAAENEVSRDTRGVERLASMRPRPRPRKTATFGTGRKHCETRFNEAAAAAAENVREALTRSGTTAALQ